MGVTVAYRGRIADLGRVEDFEDRVLDLALEVGGLARIWRSHDDDHPERMVRGLILNLAPGLEPTSLLLSPEGWLIGLVDIKDAECGRLTEPPWCFTKTQFGPIEGHVALVETLTALRDEFLTDLEISDDGGYYPTRDAAELARRRAIIQEGIDLLAEGLQRHGLSREAAEDPEILVRHIERVAAQVHQVLRRPAEHPPVTFPDEDLSGAVPDREAAEALADEMFKHNRRQQERLQRDIEERRSRGQGEEEAIEGAIDDLGLDLPGEEPDADDQPWEDDEGLFAAAAEEPGPEEAGSGDEEADDLFDAREERHPLLRRSRDLLLRLHQLFQDADDKCAPSLHTLFEGAGDLMGGLAQALSGPEDEDAPDAYGLHVIQLKRALRGAGFARGALFGVRSALTAKEFEDLQRTLAELEKEVFQELGRRRSSG